MGDRAECEWGEFLMANYLTNDTDLGAVADAIRNKGGTSAPLTFPQGFVDAVGAIETGGGGLNTITIDVVSYRSYGDAYAFVKEVSQRIGIAHFIFEAIFNNNTDNSRAGIWLGGANSSNGRAGLVKRVGASGDFSYGVDVYAGSSITINYATID